MVLNYMNSIWLFVKRSVKNCLQVDSKEFMCVTLLTNSVAAPNSRERLDDRARIRTLALRQLLNEGDVTTLVTRLSWALALLHMMLAKTEGVERQGMRQALHDRIEEAGVT